jgi:hypothetical protein
MTQITRMTICSNYQLRHQLVSRRTLAGQLKRYLKNAWLEQEKE